MQCVQLACGDGGSAKSAETPFPIQVEVDSRGVIYLVHDVSTGQIGTGLGIRRIGLDGVIETIPRIDEIRAIDLDAQDRLIVANSGSSGLSYFRLEDGAAVAFAATEGYLRPPAAIAAAGDGGFYVADGRFAVRRVTPDGRIFRIAGKREPGFAGDGGPAGSALFASIRALELGPNGDLWIADAGNERVQRITGVADCSLETRPELAIGGLVNGSDFSARLAPGTVFSVFGRGLGPEEIALAEIGPDGRLTTQLAGTRVLFDGVPAPLIFASDGQVSGVSPFGVAAGAATVVTVGFNGVNSDLERILPLDTAPALFTLDSSGRGPVAALNEDGTVNSAENPAAPGSIVVLYGTGGGRPEPAPLDGAVAAGAAPLADPVGVTVGFEPAQVLYAGSAPGLVEGVVQINVRISDSLSDGAHPVDVTVGANSTTIRGERRPTLFVASLQ